MELPKVHSGIHPSTSELTDGGPVNYSHCMQLYPCISVSIYDCSILSGQCSTQHEVAEGKGAVDVQIVDLHVVLSLASCRGLETDITPR